jgi:hypothetical protein
MHPMELILFLFCCLSFSIGYQGAAGKEVYGNSGFLQEFLGQLNIETLFEFTKSGSIEFVHQNQLDPNSLKNLAKEWSRYQNLNLPRRSTPISQLNVNRLYQGFASHTAFSEALSLLSEKMLMSHISQLDISELKFQADKLFLTISKRDSIYHCFHLHYFWKWKIRTVTKCLSRIEFGEIHAILNLDSKEAIQKKAISFSADIKADENYNADSAELARLSLAMEKFGKMTFLKDDLGGWKGNMATELFPLKKGEANCLSNSMTFIEFLNHLYSNGYLKSFAPEVGFGFRKAWALWHTAPVIYNIRTTKSFIVDSWFDGGGQVPRILKIEDWLGFKDTEVVPLNLPKVFDQ